MKSLFPILLISLLPAFAMAKGVFVHDVETQETALKAPVQELIKSAVNSESGYELVLSETNAEIQLYPKLMKLGASYLVTIDKRAGDKHLFTAKMKSSTADDLDTVSGRVVRSALRGVEAKETAQVDDVTQDEVKRGTNRFEATRHWRVGLGPALGRDMNTGATGTHFLLGYVWGLDSNWDVDLAYHYTSFSMAGETGASFNNFSIGANYNFGLNRNAPYVSAGFGRGFASVSEEERKFFNFASDRASGWSGHVGVGMRFFRTSSVNFAVEATYTQLFAVSSDGGHSPGVYNGAIVILF